MTWDLFTKMNRKLYEKIKVSVIICTYNSWKYIINTIKSILNQTYSNFEILILDNNSTDKTIEYIEQFKDERIKLFKWKKNIWPYKWLNFLLKNATWNYIAIQDHDDLWHKQKLEKQVQFLEKNKEYIWCWTETIMYYENNKTYFNYYLKEKNYYTVHPSLVFRNNNIFRYDEKLTYFWDAYSQKNNLCKNKKLIYNIKKPLTLHIIKWWYSNFTYSWFKFNLQYIKRIFDLHNFSFYSFFVLFYEIFRKLLLIFLKIFKNEKIFIFFDRLPYKLTWNKIQKISETNNSYIKEIRDNYL